MFVYLKSRTQQVTAKLCYETDIVNIPFPTESVGSDGLLNSYLDALNSETDIIVIPNELTTLHGSIMNGADTGVIIENDLITQHNNILNA